MVTYDTNLTELGISDFYLNKLHQQSIYVVGDLLITINQKIDIKNKIPAVKELKEMTDLGLVQSKDIIDLGLPPKSWKITSAEKNSAYDTKLTDLGITGTALNDLNKQSVYTLGELLRLVDKKTDMKNNKLSAVRELRDVTGLGLKESKDIIDSYGLPPESWKQPLSTGTDAAPISHETKLTELNIPPETLRILQ
jgi:Ribosomal protein L7/L12